MNYIGKERKGFTLVEILLVTFIVAILATVALTSYVNSADTFRFFGEFQRVMSTLQAARSLAINNGQQDEGAPQRYGACIGRNVALTFIDQGRLESQFDPSDEDGVGIEDCLIQDVTTPASADTDDFDLILPDKNFKFENYSVIALKSDGTELGEEGGVPIFVYYELKTGDISIFDKNGQIAVSNEKSIILRFSDGEDRVKYLKISQISGVAEEVGEPEGIVN